MTPHESALARLRARFPGATVWRVRENDNAGLNYAVDDVRWCAEAKTIGERALCAVVVEAWGSTPDAAVDALLAAWDAATKGVTP